MNISKTAPAKVVFSFFNAFVIAITIDIYHSFHHKVLQYHREWVLYCVLDGP